MKKRITLGKTIAFGLVLTWESVCCMAYVDVLNATGNTVRFKYVNPKNDIAQITRKAIEIESFEVPAGKRVVLYESFTDLNYKVAGASTTLRKIEMFFITNLVGIIYLKCSECCPDPYYSYERIRNPHGVVLNKKIERVRGGSSRPAVLEIAVKPAAQ